uniref:F-box domain-containing protein n=1 Tax=Arundo donax TaxID=35708 RepID=A0A0A9DYP5_ARUDO
MGMLALLRLMSMKRRQRTQDGGSTASSPAKRKGSPCRHGGNSGGTKRMKSHLTLDSLPQDVLQQIVALLPMQDAARTACVSRQLLLSWRHYPELEFSAKTLALDEQHTCIQGQMASDFIRRIDGAIQKRAGIWVKRLRFELHFLRRVRGHHINHWLDAATSRIEELTLKLPRDDEMKYRFPCKLFFDEKGCSIQSICLYACAFRPEQGSCSFRSLKRVQFSWVHITTEESWLFLSNSPALEHLELEYCHEIACLRIPCTLQLLNFLRVGRCNMLQTIENDAPNLSTFHYEGPIIQFTLGDSLQLKDVNISIYPWFNLFDYARKELPTVAPNLETLFLMSADEVGDFYPLSIVPHEKFLHLKFLELAIVGPRSEISYHFQYFSLVTFLNASPALETFILHVEESAVQKSHLVIDPSKLVELPRHCHQNIKHVKITGFCPITELVEMIFYILENAASLQCLTLDNRIHGFEKVSVARIAQDTGTRDYQEWQNNFGDNEEFLQYMRRQDPNPYWQAYISHIAIKKYILGRVPSSVELKILGAPPDEIISSLSASEGWWNKQTCTLAGW